MWYGTHYLLFFFNIVQVYNWMAGKALKPATSYEDYRFFETYYFEDEEAENSPENVSF